MEENQNAEADSPQSGEVTVNTQDGGIEIEPQPKKKNRTMMWAAIFLGAIFLTIMIVCHNPGKKAAKDAYPSYSSLVSTTRSSITTGITVDNFKTICNNINSIESMESIYRNEDNRFNEASSLENLFETQIQKAYDTYVSTANTAKAYDVKVDNYYNALRLKEDAYNYYNNLKIKEDKSIREKYNALADKYSGIKRVDFVMISNSNDTSSEGICFRLRDGKLVKDADAKPFVASSVTYMNLYFEFEGFYGVNKEYGNQTFYVKILKPDGSLSTGPSSPNGYSYKHIHDESNGLDGKVWCSGWGNEQKTTYKAGTYKVQVYHKGRQLFSVPVIFK